MLWSKAQARQRRDERRRMAQLFGATADALRHVVVPLWAGKKGGRPKTPWYLEGERAIGKGLADLIRDYPGHVAGPPEFIN